MKRCLVVPREQVEEPTQDDAGRIVYWTPRGGSWHSRDCRTIANSNTVLSGSIEEAGDREPCRVCQ